METNPIRVCELLVGLPDVTVLGVEDVVDEPLQVHVETRIRRPHCAHCASSAVVKERPLIELVDLPVFGRPARLVWRKHRWECVEVSCRVKTWTAEDPRIAPARLSMTDRAGR